MKFKIGDKVKLRDGLEVGEKYGGIMLTRSMSRHVGETLEIEIIADGVRYYLKESYLPFSEEMLEPIVDDPLAKKIEERNNKPPILEGKDFNHKKNK